MSDTAAAQLPQLTKQESYLAAFEDDELLPIIANKRPSRTERDRLGLAQDRLGGGSLALHDELGEQLVGVSRGIVRQHHIESPLANLWRAHMDQPRCPINSN